MRKRTVKSEIAEMNDKILNGSTGKKRRILNNEVVLCILPVICCIVCRLLKLTDEANMKLLMRMALMGIAVYGVYLIYKKSFTAGKLIFMIIIAGSVLRVGYTLYTHAFARGHDIGMNGPEGVGHWGYIYHILKGHLPPSNEYQFYQPPLYYMISAVFVKIMMLFKGAEEWNGFEYIPQLVSCVCSIVGLITVSKILDELNISKRVQIISLALAAFYPAQILASGMMNNDSMVQMFMLLSLLYTLRWHKNRTMGNIIGIALSIGFGMMTKINCGIIAVITGPLMIYHFVKTVKSGDKNEIKNIILQFVVFAVICFPLGLWYGIRNYIKFDQPLTYVHKIPISIQYKGDVSWIKRFITFPLLEFKILPFVDLGQDDNIWLLLIKTGVHGEFKWDTLPPLLGWTIEYVHMILMAITVYSVCFSLIKDKELEKTAKFSTFFLWVCILASFIQFNILYPNACTANFRYILPAQIAGGCFVAYFCDYCYRHRERKINRRGLKLCLSVVGLFCAMSIIHFC